MRSKEWIEMMKQEKRKQKTKPRKKRKPRPRKPKAPVEPPAPSVDQINPGKRRFNFDLKANSSITPTTS